MKFTATDNVVHSIDPKSVKRVTGKMTSTENGELTFTFYKEKKVLIIQAPGHVITSVLNDYDDYLKKNVYNKQ